MRYTIEKFTNFLKGINLNHYKELYSPIKTVEMDLPKNIQAVSAIYEAYWNKEDSLPEEPISFEEFYEIYFNKCKDAINTFWDKSGFEKGCNCFLKGLKARIYRTWASLITQIHAGYVAESVFGKNSVEMGTDLDHKGIDILVHYKNKDIKVQIKKKSKRPEIARMYNKKETNDDMFDIWYVVPSPQDYEHPYYKISKRYGELRDSLKCFLKYNEEGTLDRLENGFVIFTKKEFELIKEQIEKECD